MSFEFAGALAQPSIEFKSLFEREWDRMARPGTWWSGSARVAIAAAAREDRWGIPPPEDHRGLPDAVRSAVRRVSVEPMAVTREWVASLEDGGLWPTQYVEMVGVVSRVLAVDAVHRGIGAEFEPLPAPQPGAPSKDPPPYARRGKAFCPMVPGSNITSALSLVPDESSAQNDVDGLLYMTGEEMADLDFSRSLHRTQIEFVAARVSYNNECVF